MAIILTSPETIGFSKDVILFGFEDDRAGIIPGIESEAILGVGNPVLPGAQVVLRWGDKDLRFVASDTPRDHGAEIPTYPVVSLATQEAYMRALAACFEKSFFINEDFEVSIEGNTVGPVTIWSVKFTARRKGAAYNLQKTTFAGGAVTPTVIGTDDSTIPNNSVYVEVWMQIADGFERKYHGSQLFDENGFAQFDVASILHSNMGAEIPDMVLPVAERCTQSRKKYYLRYAPAGGENFSIGEVKTTAEHIVLLGGFAEWKKGPQSVIDKFAPGPESLLMLLRPRLRVIRQDEPVFVSWVNFGASGKTIHASAKVIFEDGSELITNTNFVSNVLQYEKLIFGISFNQLMLWVYNGQGRIVREYTVQIKDDLGAVSEPYRLIVNYAHQEYVRYFAYINSYGSIDTLMTYGKGSANWKIFREQAEKVLPYHFNSKDAQYVEWDQHYQDNQEVATGWMRKKELKIWLDMFISPLKYRISAGSAYAIGINSDTIQRGTDGDNLYGLTFEYQYFRIFDSLSEEELEGEDAQDFIPPNVVLAGSISQGSSGGGGNGSGGNLRVDPYPVANSSNPVSSGGVFNALARYQPLLPEGDNTQYRTGTNQLRDFRTAVNAAEKDPTVPTYAKTLTGIAKILADLEAVNPGINARMFDGHDSEYYLQKSEHPAFQKLPPIVVETGAPFVKYLDLSTYKTSYHNIADLKVDVQYNNLKLKGVELDVDGGLILKISGTINENLPASEQALLAISDLNRNQTLISLTVQSLPETEIPDERPLCPKGPFHFPGMAVIIVNNGEMDVPFDGEGVITLAWKIVKNPTDATVLREGEVSPATNIFKITFPPLPGGSYYLGIEGASCKSGMDFRQINLAGDTTIAWAAGYPKYEGGVFKTKITDSSQQLTEVYNTTTNAKMYSALHDYVADVTEIAIPRTGGWPDDFYRINVGSLTVDITVGTPVLPPSVKFHLKSGWDGAVIQDLAGGGDVAPENDGELSVSYSSDGGNTGSYKMDYSGSAFPVSYLVKNSIGATVHSVSSQDSQISVSESVIDGMQGEVTFELIDNAGASSKVVFDMVALLGLRKLYIGFTNPNGSVSSHKEAITRTISRGFNMVGLGYHEVDVQNDTMLSTLGNSEFDPTISHTTYERSYDEVVDLLHQHSIAGKISLITTRYRTNANNGNDITLFFDKDADVAMREDGTPTYNDRSNTNVAPIVGSFASPAFKAFCILLATNFAKRYKKAFKLGVLRWMGTIHTTSAEAEFLTRKINADGTDGGPSFGDFHVNYVEGFRAKFPTLVPGGYDLEDARNFIASNVQNDIDSEVTIKWRWYQQDVRRRFMWDVIDAILAIPGWEQKKFWVDDEGTYVDPNGLARGNANTPRMHHIATGIVKSNDNTGLNQDLMDFSSDHLAYQAKKVSAIFMREPSPAGMGTSVTPLSQTHKNEVIRMVNFDKERGGHFSWFMEDLDDILAATGIMSQTRPKNPPRYKTISGNKRALRFTYPLSQLYSEGGYYNFITEYRNFIAAQGVTMVDVITVDDIDPDISAEVPADGEYEGMLPQGFNVSFQSDKLGFDFNAADWWMEMETAPGQWATVKSGGMSVGNGTNSYVQYPLRMFQIAGVDSRFENYQGTPLNRIARFRATYRFKLGSNIVKTYQKVFRFSKIEITASGWRPYTSPGYRSPVIGGIKYNGADMVTYQASWVEPWQSADLLTRRVEYSVDNVTWHEAAAWFPESGIIGTSNIVLINEASPDNFPPGSRRTVRIRNGLNHAIVSGPFIVNQGPAGQNEETLLGTYSKTVGNRVMTYKKDDRVVLALNADGTITDATPGLDRSGPINKLGDKYVFYKWGYYHAMDTGSGGARTYNKMANVYVADGIYSLEIMYTIYNNVADFITHNDNGVTSDNSQLSEIFFSIRTADTPDTLFSWLKVSRKQLFPFHGIDFTADGTFGAYNINKGDTPAQYQAIGVNTELGLSAGPDQALTWKVIKYPQDNVVPTIEELHAYGLSYARAYGFTRHTIVMNEIPENTQGGDPHIFEKIVAFDDGILAGILENDPTATVEDICNYGAYGGDDYNLLFNRFMIQFSRSELLEAITTKAHKVRDPATGSWGGDTSYWVHGSYLRRHANINYYMFNSVRHILAELLVANERFQVGCFTWPGGVVGKRKIMVVTGNGVQSLANGANGNGIEYAAIKDVIPFANGEIACKNLVTASLWSEYIPLGFYATWICGGGIGIWGGYTVGVNAERYNKMFWFEQENVWIHNNGSREVYVPGQNGAPALSGENDQGVEPSLHTSCIDAAYAGWTLAKKLKSDVIYHAAYTSSRGSFTPTPGDGGLHLNGKGPGLNYGNMNAKDAYDAKMGTPLVGETDNDGDVVVYRNEHLADHEYEDNVVVTHQGRSISLGRCYGRQIYWKYLPA